MRAVPARFLVASFLLAALLSWPGGAHAAEPPVARVVWTSGEVDWRAAADQEWRPVTPHLLLSAGSEVRTGPAGRAEIVYQTEAARLWIERETLVILGESYRAAMLASTGGHVRLPGDLPPFRAALVRVGSVWAEVRSALSRLWRFEVETPTAVAGVRGTRFRVSVTPEGETRLYVAQGVVELRTSSRRVLVPEGRVANARPGGSAPSFAGSGAGDKQGAPPEWDDDLWEGDEADARNFRDEGEEAEPEFVSELEEILEESEEDRYRWLTAFQPLLAEELADDAELLQHLIDEVRRADDGERSGLLAWLLSLQKATSLPEGDGAHDDDWDEDPDDDAEHGAGQGEGPGVQEDDEEDEDEHEESEGHGGDPEPAAPGGGSSRGGPRETEERPEPEEAEWEVIEEEEDEQEEPPEEDDEESPEDDEHDDDDDDAGSPEEDDG